ncbi:MAG TPA: alpha/beta hydrolase-fold protein, partial [Candidatus Limnocylindrales bacterium]|nr:alpha/beta hydrolase-fold protein [Candidatus Limnocylindrales bacterium]
MRIRSLLTGLLALLLGCKSQPPAPPDHPRLSPSVRLQDVTFHSAALGRSMEYRVVLPAELSPGQSLHVIYLLHGGGGGFRDWTNYSDVAHYADEGILLVMPEGESSYYMNSATRVQDRFEDYITHDLIADVEEKFPVRRQGEDRA